MARKWTSAAVRCSEMIQPKVNGGKMKGVENGDDAWERKREIDVPGPHQPANHPYY